MLGPTNSEIASAVSTLKTARKVKYWKTENPEWKRTRISDSSSSIGSFLLEPSHQALQVHAARTLDERDVTRRERLQKHLGSDIQVVEMQPRPDESLLRPFAQ